MGIRTLFDGIATGFRRQTKTVPFSIDAQYPFSEDFIIPLKRVTNKTVSQSAHNLLTQHVRDNYNLVVARLIDVALLVDDNFIWRESKVLYLAVDDGQAVIKELFEALGECDDLNTEYFL